MNFLKLTVHPWKVWWERDKGKDPFFCSLAYLFKWTVRFIGRVSTSTTNQAELGWNMDSWLLNWWASFDSWEGHERRRQPKGQVFKNGWLYKVSQTTNSSPYQSYGTPIKKQTKTDWPLCGSETLRNTESSNHGKKPTTEWVFPWKCLEGLETPANIQSYNPEGPILTTQKPTVNWPEILL